MAIPLGNRSTILATTQSHLTFLFIERETSLSISQTGDLMARKTKSFRVGRVRGDLRGKVWYLTYFELGQRRRPKVGPDQSAAKQMAAQINAELESGTTATLSFQAVAIE